MEKITAIDLLLLLVIKSLAYILISINNRLTIRIHPIYSLKLTKSKQKQRIGNSDDDLPSNNCTVALLKLVICPLTKSIWSTLPIVTYCDK